MSLVRGTTHRAYANKWHVGDNVSGRLKKTSTAARLRVFIRPGYGPSMLRDFREYIDRLHIDGHTIGDDHDDDPVLIDPDGRAVDTWREGYPYDERMPREEYDEAKYLLQVELLKFQSWTNDTGAKHVLLFEGRDAAGKGGTIKRFMEHLNPRYARTVALSKPSD